MSDFSPPQLRGINSNPDGEGLDRSFPARRGPPPPQPPGSECIQKTGSELTRLAWAGRGLEKVLKTAARGSGT